MAWRNARQSFGAAAFAAAGAFVVDRTSHCKTVHQGVVPDTKQHISFIWGRGKGIQDIPDWFGGRAIKSLSFGSAHSAAVCDKGVSNYAALYVLGMGLS